MRNSIFIPIKIGSSKQNVETLINCGACGLFIDQNFSKKFKVEYLEEPIKAFNVYGTKNKKETIKSYVDLEFRIEHKKFKERFYMTGLGKQKIILGFPWLHKLDDQKLLSTPFNLGNHGQTEGRQILHKTGCTLGVQ